MTTGSLIDAVNGVNTRRRKVDVFEPIVVDAFWGAFAHQNTFGYGGTILIWESHDNPAKNTRQDIAFRISSKR